MFLFVATEGCLQYNSKGGYYYNHPYFSTAIFKNIHVGSNNVTKLRLGVAAKNDGHVRLAPVKYPYDSTVMNEIGNSTLYNLSLNDAKKNTNMF